MKKAFLFLALLVCTTIFAQDFSSLEKMELKSDESYVKAEPKVLECANYLFAHPVKEAPANRALALQFILKWMEGTSHTFNIDKNATDLVGENQDLFGLLIAGMSKVVIDSGKTELTDNQVLDRAAALLAVYCNDKNNQLEITKGLKKYLKQ